MMVFIATLAGIVIAMILMALGVISGRPYLQKGCGSECNCFEHEQTERGGRNA
jgi:hypothetical protein